ncbi:unnamed protein product, partial [Brassica oleracea]
ERSIIGGVFRTASGAEGEGRILYRRALKDTLNWAVHRHIFYRDASDLREKFNANQDVEDVDRIDKLIALKVTHGEAEYDKWRHPDPYIVPWAPGGSKFCRNPTPPAGIEIVYNYGQEDTTLNPYFFIPINKIEASRGGLCFRRFIEDFQG